MCYTIYAGNDKVKTGEKITFYTNGEEDIILNEEQFNELVVKTALKEFDECNFKAWLYDNYDDLELDSETAESLADLKQEYMEELIEDTKIDMYIDGWGKVEYTVK